VRIERVVLVSDSADDECVVNQALAANGTCVAPGFGASDCRARCGTHLWRVSAWGP
jgi:Uri superfamily endonuclease